MLLIIESVVLCILFTVMVYFMSKNPIKTLYNYPPKIQERVKTLNEYKNEIPSNENKIVAKIFASVIFIVILCVLLRYINGYTTFKEAFLYGFFLWTIVNLYDVIILDFIWFCHSKRFVFKGTEDMVEEYHNYWFHIKGFIIGEILAVIICSISGLIIQFMI